MNFDRMRALILEQAIQGKLVPQLESEPKVAQIKTALDRVPFVIPEKWQWVSLGEISKKIHYGYTASAKEIGNVKLLRITDIQNGFVNWEAVPFCSATSQEIEKFKLNYGDIVIARTGGTIGKSFLFEKNIEEIVVFASYLIRVIPELTHVNPNYLLNFLYSPCYWIQLVDGSRGTGQPNVNARTLSEIKVPLPPIEEQCRIVAKINKIFAQIDRAEKAYNELSRPLSERFRQLCLEKAIQGRLVPQLESEPDAKQIGVEPKEVPFVIPEKWKWRAFPVAVKNISAKSYQIKSSEVLRYGALPVVSQSKQRIDGYSNNKSKAIPTELLPIVIFGDHTRVTKYVNFPFIVGADGTKLLRPIHEDLTPEFLYFFVQFMSQQIRDRGYSRHFQFLKSTFVPIPPKQEQIRIVAKLKEIFDTVNAI